MLAKLGCTYVVIGHSERRQYHGEDDALVNAKVQAAYKHGLMPIMCIGEGLEDREAGIQVAGTRSASSTAASPGIPADKARTIVIAYEPVWAIGTGVVATPAGRPGDVRGDPPPPGRALLQEVADAIRILYGGSVKAANVAEIMASRTSTARSSAARAWTPTSSWPSRDSACTRPTRADQPDFRVAGREPAPTSSRILIRRVGSSGPTSQGRSSPSWSSCSRSCS